MRNKEMIEKQSDFGVKICGFKNRIIFWAAVSMLFLYSTVIPRTVFASDSLINCDAHKGVCSQQLGDVTVSLEITPRPIKAMQELVFKVSITGPPPSKLPFIDLGMPAMKMGPNRVFLKNNGQDVYSGKGVIVRCASGRRTWYANVTVPESGEVKFIFDVIY